MHLQKVLGWGWLIKSPSFAPGAQKEISLEDLENRVTRLTDPGASCWEQQREEGKHILWIRCNSHFVGTYSQIIVTASQLLDVGCEFNH